MIFTIAWRNLWRNKRRTLITISSIFFAVLVAILMRSFQLGYYNNALNSIIEQFTGHIQIQQRDYFLNPSIDNVLLFDDYIKQVLDNDSEVKQYIPRLQGGVLFSGKRLTKVGMVIGVDIQKEINYSQLDKKVAKYYINDSVINLLEQSLSDEQYVLLQKNFKGYYTSRQSIEKKMNYFSKDLLPYLDTLCKLSQIPGRYLTPNDSSVLIGSKLAEYLNLRTGDSIVLLGEGYHGQTAVGKFQVAGILNFPNPQFNESMVYMPLNLAQEFFSTYDITPEGDTLRYVSYISVNTVYKATIQPLDYAFIAKVRDDLQEKFGGRDIRVLGWQELNREMVQQIQSDNAGGLIMLIVLFIIIGFGVFGTVLMMTAERRKEFGIQMAIGMKRSVLVKIVSTEILIMTLLGVILAVIVSIPIILYGHYHPLYIASPEIEQAFAMFNMEPIMPMSLFGLYMITQPLIVTFIVMLTAIYAVFYIKKLRIPDAIRN